MRSAVVVALLVIPAGLAEAHIHLLEPKSRTDDVQGNPQKTEHCGDPAQTRIPARVTTFAPGQTITLQIAETVPHLGWYRIAFQPNGQTFQIPPAGTTNNGAGNASNYPNDATGTTDATTGTMVLKDMIPDMTPTMTMVDVTLPNMECNNCTLQLIQVMTDTPTYEPATDLYFNCADITLSANAPDAGTGNGTGPDAGIDNGGNNNGDTSSGGELSGGCSTGSGAGLGALALLGLVGLRRRRR